MTEKTLSVENRKGKTYKSVRVSMVSKLITKYKPFEKWSIYASSIVLFIALSCKIKVAEN